MANKKQNNTNTYAKKKSMGMRIFIIFMAAAMLLGIMILPILAHAEENDENLVVSSFETGKLSEALSKAADGTDYNFIKNVAVLSGTLSAEDYTALTAIPNLEILELAGTETEDGVIPENALTSRNQLALITLPKNTKKIGKNAFSCNRKLVKVKMPSTVTEIGDFAFDACELLTEIPVSEGVTYIGEGAFRDCKALEKFVIPGGITEIYPDTFSKCGFSEIYIGPNVTKIGAGVFADCNALKDVYAYGETAPTLGNDVFRNVSAAIHCYADSEESYESWLQQNMTLAGDLTGEYTVTAVVPAENEQVYETKAAEAEEKETEAETSEAETSEETKSTAAEAVQAQQTSGGVSVGTAVVIAVMAAVIGVLATVVIMLTRKKK
ncbi:MAG: leucine-rich repeat domain-containing protein [Oscillospiraceae bacterium]|nr:leucine-rich repeat domain-containing protein [Oscillospiraceae bacterium]